MARMLNAKELITQNKRKAPKTKTVIIVIATSIIPLPAMVKLYSFFITNFLAFLNLELLSRATAIRCIINEASKRNILFLKPATNLGFLAMQIPPSSNNILEIIQQINFK